MLYLLIQIVLVVICSSTYPPNIDQITFYQGNNIYKHSNQMRWYSSNIKHLFLGPFRYDLCFQNQYYSRIFYNLQAEEQLQTTFQIPDETKINENEIPDKQMITQTQIIQRNSLLDHFYNAIMIIKQITLAYVQFFVQRFKYLVKSDNISKYVQYEQNFASLNGGAIILSKSSHKIKNQKAILEDNKDNYMYFDQLLPVEITIALKQQVKIQRIIIKSSQIYSSTIKDFILEGSFSLNRKNNENYDPWFPLLQQTAKNNGQQQNFNVKNKVVKFLRLRILSKYGNWKYFTLTQIKVYGEGLLIEALSSYQIGYQSGQKMSTRPNTQLSNDLSAAYDQLFDQLINEKQPDENIITHLVGQVQKLSKIGQFQIFYMHNLTKKVQNMSKIERQFRQHKNQYDSIRKFQQKYLNRFLAPKIHELEVKLSEEIQKNKKILEKLKASQKYVPEQICQQPIALVQESFNFDVNTIVLIVVINLICSFVICMVIYCCLKYWYEKQAVKDLPNRLKKNNIKKHNSSK